MADRKGDDSKQTAECRMYSAAENDKIWASCPHMNYVENGDTESEKYCCQKCGASYTLFYEDMK